MMVKAHDDASPPVGEGGSAAALPGEGSGAIATPHPSRRKGGSPPSPSRGQGNRYHPSPPVGEGGSAAALPGEGSLLKRRARSMRREPTEAEKKLWYALRNRRFGKWKFRRQVPIGRFVVDFLCCEKWLIIEVDGGQHNERDSDLTRDAWFRSQGYMTLRYWNTDVLENLDGVLSHIECALATPHPSRRKGGSPPSPSRGEGRGGPGENTNA
jgi:very-short-patch-repair endonuclease